MAFFYTSSTFSSVDITTSSYVRDRTRVFSILIQGTIPLEMHSSHNLAVFNVYLHVHSSVAFLFLRSPAAISFLSGKKLVQSPYNFPFYNM